MLMMMDPQRHNLGGDARRRLLKRLRGRVGPVISRGPRTDAPADELLALGVERFLPGTFYERTAIGFARLRRSLSPRALPGRMPAALARHLVCGDGPDGSEQPERRGPSACAARGDRHGQADSVGSDRARAIVFIDIESLGFIGKPLFLIGGLYATARPDGPWSLELVQYLARDYAEEEAILRAFAHDASGADLWVSFNGRTFDLPFLELRAAYFRLPALRPRRHLDLLPVARRCWAEQLPDCRLKTLERWICGRPRGSVDIESGRVPEAYHAFVRTGEPHELIQILGHNASDLTSLVDIYARAVAALDG